MSTAVPPRRSARARARVAGLTRQTWTAASAAIIFVTSALLLSFVPIPYVVWTPGGAYDLLGSIDADGKQVPVIDVAGVPTYPTTGRLDLVTISESRADSMVSLPEALIAHWAPKRDVLPRALLYPAGISADQVRQEDAQEMNLSQRDAVVAAFSAAGFKITAMPMVSVVVTSGPSYGHLEPGDFILKVDDTPVTTREQALALVRRHAIGDRVIITYLRDGTEGTATIEVVGSNQVERTPVIGVKIEPGYAHDGRVKFNVDSAIGGPSGGLMFALGLYDRVTNTDLLAGRHIAGTGTITSKGEVGPIGGIQEKIGAAERAGATIFLVPQANCADLAGISTTMRLVKVGSLATAISALQKLKNPTAQGVPTCS